MLILLDFILITGLIVLLDKLFEKSRCKNRPNICLLKSLDYEGLLSYLLPGSLAQKFSR